jgi:hypothetical protein
MGNVSRARIVISGGVLAVTVAVHGETAGLPDRPPESRGPLVRRVDSSQSVTAPAGPVSTLRVHRIRLEAAPPPVPKASLVLKFDLVNDGSVTVGNVILEVAIREKPSTDADAASQVVAGPFTIRGEVDLQAGYTLNYEMLLRNLPSDCNCVADVAIVASGGPAAGATTSR